MFLHCKKRRWHFIIPLHQGQLNAELHKIPFSSLLVHVSDWTAGHTLIVWHPDIAWDDLTARCIWRSPDNRSSTLQMTAGSHWAPVTKEISWWTVTPAAIISNMTIWQKVIDGLERFILGWPNRPDLLASGTLTAVSYRHVPLRLPARPLDGAVGSCWYGQSSASRPARSSDMNPIKTYGTLAICASDDSIEFHIECY